MEKRTACVNQIKGSSISYSSVMAIGDTEIAQPKSSTIAVQKETPVFTRRDDVPFNNYSVFTMPAPAWPLKTVSIHQQVHHHQSTIQVGNTRFTGADTSSILQVGSISKLSAESRIKHFRILESEDRNTTMGVRPCHRKEDSKSAQGT